MSYTFTDMFFDSASEMATEISYDLEGNERERLRDPEFRTKLAEKSWKRSFWSKYRLRKMWIEAVSEYLEGILEEDTDNEID